MKTVKFNQEQDKLKKSILRLQLGIGGFHFATTPFRSHLFSFEPFKITCSPLHSYLHSDPILFSSVQERVRDGDTLGAGHSGAKIEVSREKKVFAI